MNIDIKQNPFTTKEAFLSIIEVPKHKGGGLWIKTLIRPEWGRGNKKVSNLLLKLIPLDRKGHICDYRIDVQPHRIRITCETGSIMIHVKKYNEIQLDLQYMGMCFEHDHEDNQASHVITTPQMVTADFQKLNQYIKIVCHESCFDYDAVYRRVYYQNDKNSATVSVCFWVNNLNHPENHTINHTPEEIRKSFSSFLSHYPVQSEHDMLALYTLYNLEYVACGNLKRNTLAVSKNDMNLCWAWDHLFMVLVIAKANLGLAWNTMMTFVDHQELSGMFPDAINPVTIVNWFTKPPVYGYFLSQLDMNSFNVSLEEKTLLYQAIERLTNYWIDHDDFFFAAYQRPFDSGWDNATCFDNHAFAYTPDLNAYLVAQMFFLSDFAKQLGDTPNSTHWNQRAQTLLNDMITRMWKNNQFMCFNKNQEAYTTTSLIRFIPMILADRLPQHIVTCMVEELSVENSFLTKQGLATENIQSRLYDTRRGDSQKPNAYWRGPMWAPPTYMIIKGLRSVNHHELADEITYRYLRTIETYPAFYEDYDAIFPIGYDDFGYGWTAAVYLLLKQQANAVRE